MEGNERELKERDDIDGNSGSTNNNDKYGKYGSNVGNGGNGDDDSRRLTTVTPVATTTSKSCSGIGTDLQYLEFSFLTPHSIITPNEPMINEVTFT